jgi:Acyl transferase domain
LEQQLKTLASQLTTVRTLLDRGVVPNKVLGYCFGEYAAAITAGILSEETVVNILVRRAMVLRNIKGAMLNVFCEAPIVRRSLSSIASPPNIAIIAGPKHIVLSGSHSQIACAQSEFLRRSVKTVLVPTTLPFHSAVMDGPARNFVPFNFSPQDSAVSYISGVTGKVLHGSRLGLKYWLRHLRDPVDFYSSMKFVRATSAGEAIIDIGPDAVLTKIISRYGWPDRYSVSTPDECGALSGGPVWGTRRTPLASAATPTRPKLLTGTSFNTVNPIGVALGLLRELFGYDSSSGLLSQSLHSVGLQSMDFIRFADHFRARTGINIALSAFVSDAPLETIIREAKPASESVT